MPYTTSHSRYRIQADFALERLRQAHAAGEEARIQEWHRTWSLAEAVADAELRERGGGARLLKSGMGADLRPLPADLRSPKLAPALNFAVEPEEPIPLPPLPDDLLKRALLRRAALLQALRHGRLNPFPGELNEGEWEYHLASYQEDGPDACELLQQAEEALELLLELHPELPEPEDGTLFLDEQGELTTGTLPVCVEIYQESLLEMTELELRADLYTCLEAGRTDTVALIEAELRRREWETELGPVERPVAPLPTTENRIRLADGPIAAGETEREPLSSCSSGAELTLPRRRRAAYAVRPPPSSPPRPRSSSVPASVPPTREPPSEERGEAALALYRTAPAWVDAAGRTRTWSLLDADGEKLAEITTRRDAERLATFLNQLTAPNSEEPPSEER